jgi:GNAT superfamily N-acetyltransferase
MLAAYAELQYQAPAHFYLSIYVATEHQGSEIGTCLLQLVEASAASRCPDTLPISLTGRVSDQNQAGQRVFENAGYIHSLSFLIMEIVMVEPPQPPHWAAGITVRAFISGQDEQATYLADEEASQDKGYHQPLAFETWVNRMSLNKGYFDPTLWFLAYSENEIAGVALNFYSQETNTGWIDHLGVRRQWRRQGIGRALLLHSFGEFYQRGIYHVKLSVDAKSLTNAPRLYERAGMRLTQRYHIYSKELILNL